MTKRGMFSLVLGIFTFISFALTGLRIIIIKDNIIDGTNISEGYRLYNNYATTTFGISVFIVIALFFFIAFRYSKLVESELSYSSPFMVFGSSLLGFMLLSVGVYYCYRMLTTNMDVKPAFVVYVILSLFCAGHFIYSASTKLKPHSIYYVASSIIPAVCIIVRLATDFVATTDHQVWNSNIYHLLSLAALMLFFVNEGRFAMKRGNTMLYMFFGFTSSLLLMIFAIPKLYLTAFWFLDFDGYTLLSALDVVTAFYLIARMFSLTLSENADSSAVEVDNNSEV